jgi:hypothetical protein
MCPRCKGFAERMNLREPWEYRDIARQLIEVIDEGPLRLVKGNCPLEDLSKPKWPGDVLIHEFEWFACGQRFTLAADTYHGHARWETKATPPAASSTIQ